MFSTEAKGDQSGKWERMEIFSKSFTQRDSSSLDLTVEEWKMVGALDKLPFAHTVHMVYKNRGNYFVMNACALSIYSWVGGRWELYAGKDITGATCAAWLFFRGEELYGYTGLGYWQSHGDLFHFRKSGDVDYVKTINQPEDFFGTMNFTTSDGFYTFFGQQINLRKGIKDFLWKGFFLDFTDWTWKEVEFELNENFEKVLGRKSFDNSLMVHAAFETSDFSFIEVRNIVTQQVGLFIVDKKTLELFIIPFTAHQFEGVKKWTQQVGNQIRFSTLYKSIPNEFQIDELVQSALPLGKVSLKVNSGWKELADKYWKELLGLVLISLILLGIGKVALPKQPKNIPDPPSELGKEDNQVLSVLKSYLGQVISQEEMDRIVGIDTIKNQDLRKVRRSRAIKALNDYMIEQHGEPIIQRVRDEQDMRIIRYLIEDTFSSKSTKTPEPMIKSPL